MQYTLLDYVQHVASSMGSDAVNSINDSIESQQIKLVVKKAYFDLISRITIPEHHTLFNLNGSGDNTKPTLMYIPNTISKVLEVRYDKHLYGDPAPLYSPVTFMARDKFFDYLYRLNPDDSLVGSFTHTIDSSTITFLYHNNKAPNFYTTFDDSTIIFDGYDNTVDTTLTPAKTWCYGRKVIPWVDSDSFIPNLDEPMCQLLLSEATSLAWAEMKQTQHSKAEQSARRLWIRSQSSKKAIDVESDFCKLPNYGRK